jgi:CheY-like chemotaxis protein/two-component sensor histidine kinase
LIEGAREGAERVRAIVRDLKVVSRVEERRPSAVDVRRSVEAAIDLARNELRHRARLVAELDAVPTLWADEGRLGQLFLNLLINAAHAITEGAVDRNEVRVRLQSVEGAVLVEVSDTGVGIGPDELPRIFDPFFTTKAVGVGSGLGLSICHAIVMDLGGRIDVESDPGRGTTFRVYLPRTSPPSAPRAAPPLATPVGRRGKVMVVDDEPMILRVVAQLLRSEHDVVCESQPRAALARIERGERFDVIVCDLMMPEMTGMVLHANIEALAPEQASAMLFVTGGAFTPAAREFVERFASTTIDKPFDAAPFLEEIRRRVR